MPRPVALLCAGQRFGGEFSIFLDFVVEHAREHDRPVVTPFGARRSFKSFGHVDPPLYTAHNQLCVETKAIKTLCQPRMLIGEGDGITGQVAQPFRARGRPARSRPRLVRRPRSLRSRAFSPRDKVIIPKACRPFGQATPVG